MSLAAQLLRLRLFQDQPDWCKTYSAAALNPQKDVANCWNLLSSLIRIQSSDCLVLSLKTVASANAKMIFMYVARELEDFRKEQKVLMVNI